MADLAAAGGRVALRERAVGADEVGKPLSGITTGLGHRIYRGQQVFGFWEPEAGRLEAGDQIVEVVPRAEG
jgi:voltage-gated potassium channel